jgi:PAS domain S-box-containing protein
MDKKGKLLTKVVKPNREIEKLREANLHLSRELGRVQDVSRRQEVFSKIIPDIVMEVDKNKVYTWANSAGLAFFGADVLGKDAKDYFVGEQDTYKQVQPLFEGDGGAFYIESWQRRKDGKPRLLAWWCRNIQDEKGNITGVLSSARDVTEQRKSRELLVESEEKYRKVFETAANLITLMDDQTVIVDCNDRIKDIMGYEKSEVIGQKMDVAIHPDYLKRVKENLKNIYKNGYSKNSEYKFVKKDGTVIDVLVNSSVIKDAKGKSKMVISIAQDVTERNKAEKILKENEEKYRSLYETMVQGVICTDQNGVIVSVNPAAEKMLGVKLKDIKDKKTSQMKWKTVDANGLEFDTTKYPDALAIKTGKEIKDVVIGIYNGSAKQYSWINVNAIPVFVDVETTPYMVYTTFEDITRSRNMEKSLKESEERYRILFEKNNEAVIIVSVKTKSIKYANKAFCKLFGYTKEEAGKLNIFDIHQQDELTNTMAEYEKHLSGEVTLSKNIKCRKKDGTLIFADISSDTDVIDGEKCIIGFFRDTTAQKKMQEEKESLEKQLFQTHKMESVGRLAGGIAHDFNNLLTIILGNTMLLLSDMPEDAPTRTEMIDILDATKQASVLTNQLLLFSKKQVTQVQVHDLNSVVVHSKNILTRLIGENIKLYLKLDKDLKPVKIDIGQIEQVMMNLAINAKDAMPNGGSIEIRTDNIIVDEARAASIALQPGEYVCLSVKDTGKGMSKETLNKIFDPFFTTKSEGTGLGLSVVYGIIKQHNGLIDVQSENEVGTSFYIYLPSAGSVEKENKVNEEDPAALKGSGECILLVEDDEAVRSFIKKLLIKNNYNILEAANAKDAYDIFVKEESRIDMVFTDVILPDTNGVELVNKITDKKPGLRVLIGSGYTNESIKANILEEKGYSFMPKPYKVSSLLARIKEILAKKKN